MRAVNLLPREAPKRRRKRLTVGVQLAIVSPFVVGSLLGAGYLVTTSKVNDDRATLKALQEELSSLPSPTEQPSQDAQLVEQHDQRVLALASALHARVAWDRILREISSILPEDVWLTALTAHSPQSATPPPAAPAPGTTTDTTETTDTTATTTGASPAPAAPAASDALSISGYTYSQEGVARFLSRLAVIPELSAVKLVQSAEATVSGRVVVKFSIEAGIRPQEAA